MIHLADGPACSSPVIDDARYMPRLDPATVLFNETHHRIKNNLQLVAAMLHLQARRNLDVPVLHDALTQASHRVRAAAQLHDRLHRSAGGELHVDTYLHDLCANLSCTLGLSAAYAVVVEAPHMLLQADRILCVGLIVTELVTNAVKHGVAPSGSRDVRVVLAPAHGNTLRLLVADSGPGFPDSAVRASVSGLGLHLVRHLTRSIGGRLEIDGTPPGARFAVTFAPEPEAGPARNPSRSSDPCA